MESRVDTSNARQSLRLPAMGPEAVELLIGGRSCPALLLDQSAGGFGIQVAASVKLELGELVRLKTTSGHFEARVAHVAPVQAASSPADGSCNTVRIGLERVGEFFDGPESANKGGGWWGSGNVKDAVSLFGWSALLGGLALAATVGLLLFGVTPGKSALTSLLSSSTSKSDRGRQSTPRVEPAPTRPSVSPIAVRSEQIPKPPPDGPRTPAASSSPISAKTNPADTNRELGGAEGPIDLNDPVFDEFFDELPEEP